MPVFLLDTNVLIALAWENHSHHLAAMKWFASAVNEWATCPMTECGFIRISSNDRMLRASVAPADATKNLQHLVQHKKHIFWEDNVSLRQSVLQAPLRGHQQITDAYLLSLCLHRGGRLATFDQAILSLASTQKERYAIFLLPS